MKREDKIISIKISHSTKRLTITLKDSLLLLPNSLEKLARQFNLEVGKLIEPVYVGEGHDEYKSEDLSHYNKKIAKVNDFNIWKEDIQAYCVQDCKALYDVLVKFRELVAQNFNLDIIKYPTIPSLAFAIYRIHYMPENTIPVTQGKVFNFIRTSFTGGSTEMYKPNAIGKNIFCYDVISLYPAVMANNLFPTGQISYFEGDPTFLTDSIYWIGEAKVSTKADLYQPYLQLHHKTNAGWRTIAPNGEFNMVINSPEYFNSLKDYNISVSKGYLFANKTDLFSKYVKDMYNLRKKYTKSEPMNLIAKLLMNSLFGRFGMEPQLHNHIFATFEEIQELSSKYEILDYLELDSNLYFVSYQASEARELDSALPRGRVFQLVLLLLLLLMQEFT